MGANSPLASLPRHRRPSRLCRFLVVVVLVLVVLRCPCPCSNVLVVVVVVFQVVVT
jgi:hypothetical protein